ncbi:uncharacterized protein METZ01_LOCUS203729 [marine metagenome]|uniref:Uncharacterized protein n=1 Tax=marine metagenome TaxID=408172 RepID=A0A382EK75_9ZZZZ
MLFSFVILVLIVIIPVERLIFTTSPSTVTLSSIKAGEMKFRDCEKYKECFPGKYIPVNLENNDANNIPWQILFLNLVLLA